MNERPHAFASSPLVAARAYYCSGFSVIPLPYASKVPRIAWKEYQSHPASPSLVERWFGGGRTNIGLIMGAVSDNSIALDFDNPTLARYALGDLDALAEATFVEQTFRGHHVVFRIEGDPVRTTSFAGRGLDLDLKAEGAYIAVAPSTHPNGTPYKVLSPDLRIARITRNELNSLLRRLLNRQPPLPGLGLLAGGHP